MKRAVARPVESAALVSNWIDLPVDSQFVTECGWFPQCQGFRMLTKGFGESLQSEHSQGSLRSWRPVRSTKTANRGNSRGSRSKQMATQA